MYFPFASIAEDFYVNMRLNTQLALPSNRETVLHFFERVQRQYPNISRFRKAENGDLSIEESREKDFYRWVTLESKRLSAGFVNPPDLQSTVAFHKMLLEQSSYDLGISPVEIDYLDVLFGFDLPFRGNHDEIIAESLFANSPLNCMLQQPGAKAIDIQPSMTVSLSDDCRLQARVDVITRTNSYQVRTGDYNNDNISVYLILRRYWGDRPKESLDQLFEQMASRAQDLAIDVLVPQVLKPLSELISTRS